MHQDNLLTFLPIIIICDVKKGEVARNTMNRLSLTSSSIVLSVKVVMLALLQLCTKLSQPVIDGFLLLVGLTTTGVTRVVVVVVVVVTILQA